MMDMFALVSAVSRDATTVCQYTEPPVLYGPVLDQELDIFDSIE